MDTNNGSTVGGVAGDEKKKRTRRPAEPTGPIHPREMTKIRNEVGRLRDIAVDGNASHELGAERCLGDLSAGLSKLYTTLDRLDLRFKIHHDQSTIDEPVSGVLG